MDQTYLQSAPETLEALFQLIGERAESLPKRLRSRSKMRPA